MGDTPEKDPNNSRHVPPRRRRRAARGGARAERDEEPGTRHSASLRAGARLLAPLQLRRTERMRPVFPFFAASGITHTYHLLRWEDNF